MGGVILLLIIIVLLLCIVIVCMRRNRKGTFPVDNAIIQNTSEARQSLLDDTSYHYYDYIDQNHNTQTTSTPHFPPVASSVESNDDHGYEYGVVNQPRSDYPTGNASHTAVDQSHMCSTQTIHSPFITNSVKPNDEGNYKNGVVNRPKSDDPN